MNDARHRRAPAPRISRGVFAVLAAGVTTVAVLGGLGALPSSARGQAQGVGGSTGALQQVAYDQVTPDGAPPEGQAAPEEALPDETVPDETVPDETVPDETVPDQTLPTRPCLTRPCRPTPGRAVGWCSRRAGSGCGWSADVRA